jgi:hypothetical protein
MDIPRAFRRPSLLIKLGIAEEKPQKKAFMSMRVWDAVHNAKARRAVIAQKEREQLAPFLMSCRERTLR